MDRLALRFATLFLLFGFCSCGGGEESPSKTAQTETDAAPPQEAKSEPVSAPRVGTPTGSGYTDESIRVQIGPDEGLREQHNPSPGSEFLFVRLSANEAGTLVPADYRIELAGRKYTPYAIGFGRPNGVYSSVEYFVGAKVELVPNAADQILHDGERVQKCKLNNPFLFLVYDLPRTASPVLRHGKDAFPLSPDFSALAADLSGSGGTLTAQNQLNLTDPIAAGDDYRVKLLRTERTRLELDTEQWDVVIVELALSAMKPITVEIKKSDLRLGGDGQDRVYFHFTEDAAELTAGSLKVDGESYEGRELIGLDSGGFRVSLSPQNPVDVTMILRDPKTSGDLDLKLSSTKSVRISESGNALGKFPPPVEKLPAMVAWAPLVGSPTDAGFLSGRASIAPSLKEFASPTPSTPRDGLRHLAVTFRVERQGEFVPIDYRVADKESNTIYRPLAVAFGESPVFVKGLDYEKINLQFGKADAPQQQAGRLSGWTLKAPEVKFLYEVAPSDSYIFQHGDTQFVIEL